MTSTKKSKPSDEETGSEHSSSPRKDRVIQTRVPEDLESALKEEARKQRVTVSHLIRNVLEDTFDLVDNIVAESTHLAQTVRRDARRIAQSAQGFRSRPGEETSFVPALQGGERAQELLDTVYGWQELVMNKTVGCTRCGKTVQKGQKGMRGLTEGDPGAPVWLCLDCLSEV